MLILMSGMMGMIFVMKCWNILRILLLRTELPEWDGSYLSRINMYSGEQLLGSKYFSGFLLILLQVTMEIILMLLRPWE